MRQSKARPSELTNFSRRIRRCAEDVTIESGTIFEYQSTTLHLEEEKQYSIGGEQAHKSRRSNAVCIRISQLQLGFIGDSSLASIDKESPLELKRHAY